jgi:hypothetical protein
MNKYVRNLLGMVFQIQPTQQAVWIDPQSSPRSPEEWRKLWQAKGPGFYRLLQPNDGEAFGVDLTEQDFDNFSNELISAFVNW